MGQILDCAAFVGMDWADEEHAVCILPADGGQAERGMLKQEPEAIAAWVGALRQRFDGRPVAICLEQSRGPLLYALMSYEFLVLCPINPVQLAAYRKALDPSGAKGDPRDGELLARFLRDQGDQSASGGPTTKSLAACVCSTNSAAHGSRSVWPWKISFGNVSKRLIRLPCDSSPAICTPIRC